MLYDVPEGFQLWDLEDKVEWHRRRVEKEAPVFEVLEQAELLTCFDVGEIKARLFRVRWWKDRVEAALRIQRCQEFIQLREQLDQAAHETRELARRRALMLALQFRRKGLTVHPEEVDELANLKVAQEEMICRADDLEQELIHCCHTNGVAPDPYLVVERLRSST